MKFVIVTVENPSGSIKVDMRLPTDVNSKDLAVQMFECMNRLDISFFDQIPSSQLYIATKKRFLLKNETLSQAGIVGGNIIVLTSYDY